MVRIRLQRFGRTHRPFYRIAAIDGRTRRDGKVIENLGWYNPVAEESKQLELKTERIREWLAKGAQPSETCADIFARYDLLEGKLKQAWEERRAVESNRGETRAQVKRAEDAVTRLEELAKAGGAEVEAMLKQAKDARTQARECISTANVARAKAAADAAQAAVASAEKAAASPEPAADAPSAG